jgi:hypothetical protein
MAARAAFSKIGFELLILHILLFETRNYYYCYCYFYYYYYYNYYYHYHYYSYSYSYYFMAIGSRPCVQLHECQ